MPVDAPPENHDPSVVSMQVVGRWAFRSIVGVVVLASFAVWGYTYYLHLNRPEPPDFLADPGLAAAADQICQATLDRVAEVPGASVAATSQERSTQVRASTALFASMVDELDRFDPSDAQDQLIWRGFVGDWRTLVADRERFAQALQTDPQAQFLLTAIAGERLDRRLTRVAEANKMYSCVAPDDV